MAKEQWSDETLRLRAAASEAIDHLARSMQADRAAWGRYEDCDDEGRHLNSLEGQQLTAWVVSTQFQGFEDPETSCVVLCPSGATAATNKGLAIYAADAY